MIKEYILLIIFFTVSIEIFAQEIVTDRPDQTESSTTIPFRSFQFESGVLLGNFNLENSSEQLLLIPTILFRYSLTRIIEIRLVEQLVNIKNKQTSEENFGLSDLELGAKIQILRNPDINTEIAFLSHLVLPTGEINVTNDHLGTINKLAISHGITDFMDIGYNVGYNYLSYDNGFLTYSAALGTGITKRIGAYIETFGEYIISDDWFSNLDLGVTYLLRDNMQFDASYGLGLNHKMNYFTVGFSMNIPASKN